MDVNNSNELLTPSAKKGSSFQREYPFPIVTKNSAENQEDPNWKIMEGHLEGNCVLVHEDESIKMLYNMGFFGKGSLSKNAPQICLKERAENKRTEKKPDTCLKASTHEEVIDIVDSDEDSLSMKKERDSDEIEVVLSGSSSSSSSEDETIDVDDSPQKENESLKESLQLTFQEAYFLSFGLGCLLVKEKGQPLSLLRLWNRFCELYPENNFPVMYTAYHHFRSKGWIVKSGLQYGADYVLYKDGPPFYHSTYSVIVKGVKEQNLREMRGNRQFTWASLAALNRVNNTTGKGLLFLYVIKPNTMSENKISTPHCISQYKLEEVLYKRWVASENREQNEASEDES